MADLPAVFQRCNAVAEQRDVLVSYMAGKAQIPGQVGKHLHQRFVLLLTGLLVQRLWCDFWRVKV